MIFTSAEVEDQQGIFYGHVPMDVFSWESRLPDMSVYGLFTQDPALRVNLTSEAQGQGESVESYIGQLAMWNITSATRMNVGRMATTVGILVAEFGNIRGMYRDPIENVAMGINIAKAVLESDAFQKAMDAIGWIPIVGWIIEIIMQVALLVINIITRVRDRRDEDAREALSGIMSIPHAEFSRDADQEITRFLVQQTMRNNTQWIVEPRYPATSGSQFTARQMTPEGKYPWSGWLVHPKLGSGGDEEQESAITPGLGFMPGTRNLHGAMELRTAGGANMLDLGEFYPTARTTAVQYWEMMLAGGPAMFTVDADRAADKWADYFKSAVEFGDNILHAWSMSPSAERMGSTQHVCLFPEMAGWAGCKKSKRGDMISIPGDGHQTAYLQYMFALFHPRRIDPDGNFGRDNIDWDSITPVKALKNLKERQHATLLSMNAMYVDASEVHGGDARFRAIGTHANKGPMYDRWYESVLAIFQTGDWRNVRYKDVPEGDLKQQLRDLCSNAGITCDTLGEMGGRVDFAPGASSLGDPIPPTPDDPREVTLITATVVGKDKKKKKVGAGAVVLAAGVLGALALASR